MRGVSSASTDDGIIQLTDPSTSSEISISDREVMADGINKINSVTVDDNNEIGRYKHHLASDSGNVVTMTKTFQNNPEENSIKLKPVNNNAEIKLNMQQVEPDTGNVITVTKLFQNIPEENSIKLIKIPDDDEEIPSDTSIVESLPHDNITTITKSDILANDEWKNKEPNDDGFDELRIEKNTELSGPKCSHENSYNNDITKRLLKESAKNVSKNIRNYVKKHKGPKCSTDDDIAAFIQNNFLKPLYELIAKLVELGFTDLTDRDGLPPKFDALDLIDKTFVIAGKLESMTYYLSMTIFCKIFEYYTDKMDYLEKLDEKMKENINNIKEEIHKNLLSAMWRNWLDNKKGAAEKKEILNELVDSLPNNCKKKLTNGALLTKSKALISNGKFNVDNVEKVRKILYCLSELVRGSGNELKENYHWLIMAECCKRFYGLFYYSRKNIDASHYNMAIAWAIIDHACYQ